MEIRNLITFYEIAKVKKFSIASDILHCSESTLSIRIRNLEEELGARLFERGAKETVLSEEGRLFLPYVENIMSLMHEANRCIQDWSLSANGSISIASSHYVSCYQLPSILRTFKEMYPEIEIHVQIGHSTDVIRMVRNREAQIGIVRGPINNSFMQAINIAEDPIVLCVYPSHPLAEFSFVDLKVLKDYPLISYQKTLSYWTFIHETFKKVGIEPNIFMELDSMETTKRMVSETIGIALLPQGVIKKEVDEGVLRALQISNPPSLTRATYLFYNKDKHLTGPLKGFLEVCQQQFPHNCTS